MDEHLGYEKSERSDNDDYRNGYKCKRVNSSYGSMEIEVSQDRRSPFQPQVVKKRQKDISDIDRRSFPCMPREWPPDRFLKRSEIFTVLNLQRGLFLMWRIRSFPRLKTGQNLPLDEVYPILFIDAIHYSVRDNGVIRKLAVYVILGINTEGKKEVLTIQVGDNESSKYWLSVLNELKIGV